METSEDSRRHIKTNDFDKLLALAQAVGAIPVSNPEQGQTSFEPWLRASPESILAAIEKRIGTEIKAPTFTGGLWGLTIRGQVFCTRDFQAIYMALRIQQLIGNRARVCEIGGGAGHLAFYCHQFGCRNYTIVDLPTVAAAQAFFLAQNVGADKIRLEGEDGDAEINILAPSSFPKGRFDLVVNSDSLPEMATSTALDYIKKIKDCSGLFLSINQEAFNQRTPRAGDLQESVAAIVDRVGGFRRLYRCPFWMRRGYIEELYDSRSLLKRAWRAARSAFLQ